jgi:hypothetical protein
MQYVACLLRCSLRSGHLEKGVFKKLVVAHLWNELLREWQEVREVHLEGAMSEDCSPLL